MATKKLSELFSKAFDEYLIVNPRGGSRLRIHLGSNSEIQPFEPYDDWVAKISALPLLDQQGDGMKSFFSVLLYLMVLESKIFLLDEPEAFLHPPQARLLGEFLPELVPPSRQLFMATHSGDIIKGLLNTKSNRVKVISLRRPTKSKNNATFLNNDDLSNVWSDPLLRSSNLIEGLFHERVILCESDGDCRFYQALAVATESKLSIRTSDILFTHCNGKSRLHVAVRALRKLGVPVRVVVDFDVLQDGSELQRLYEEAGGNWNEIADFHKKVHHAIEALRGGVKTIDAKKQINEEFDKANNQNSILTDSQIERIRAILNNCSPWRLAKSTGRHLLENGDPSKAFDLLNEKLKSKDIFIVEEGELESFVKTLSKGRKSSWLENVLELDLSLSPELERARNFVARLCS